MIGRIFAKNPRKREEKDIARGYCPSNVGFLLLLLFSAEKLESYSLRKASWDNNGARCRELSA